MTSRLTALVVLRLYYFHVVVTGFYLTDILTRAPRSNTISMFMNSRPIDVEDIDEKKMFPGHAVKGDNSAGLSELRRTIHELQQQHGPDSVRLLSKDDSEAASGARPINSLVFLLQSKRNSHNDVVTAYIVAILHENDICSRSALQDAVAKMVPRDDDDDDDDDRTVRLAASHKVAALCGFVPGTVPPLLPVVTLVEESLQVSNDNGDDSSILLLGGGGSSETQCLIRMDVLLQQPNVQTAAFRREPWISPSAFPLDGNPLPVMQHKPFFALEPPSMEEAARAILDDDGNKQFQPEPFAVVGRIRIIRRMARQLAFCDLGPPLAVEVADTDKDNKNATTTALLALPWRSPMTGQDMAVQLIVGKTLCQRLGPEQGVATIKALRIGELVLVQGMTNVGNRDSLQNWVDKACLDLVVWSIQSLEEDANANAGSKPIAIATQPKARAIRRMPPPPTRLTPGMSYLCISDLYETLDEDSAESAVQMVDSHESVQVLASDLSKLLVETEHPVGLVGLDTEWRPSFLFNNPNEPQVVLLLQICLHPLQRVHVLDLQALLRPLRLPNDSMNPLETQVSQVIAELFRSPNLFKVGFQVTNDLRRLAASYPHVVAFQEVHSVLETSTLAKTVMRLQKLGNLREVTSSLSRLTEKFIGKTINKENQCSDWSVRPLTAEQVEYAALDAIVTPCLVDRLLSVANASIQLGDKPKVGRWKDDSSFTGCTSSMRFLFLNPDADPVAIKKLSAKRVIGSPYIVTQFWATGNAPPQLPTLPSEANGQYTGADGVLRIHSRLVSLLCPAVDAVLQSVTGQQVGKSKERCLNLLLIGDAALPNGAQLEFPQRSGFVEFRDAVALFVNMPASRGSARSYPNEWRNDGQTLTWFLRESDWKQGTSSLATKLGSNEARDKQLSVVVLFVRSREGHFICCGRCDLKSVENVQSGKEEGANNDTLSSRDWDLVQLNLNLLDYGRLRTCQAFTDLVALSPG